MAKRTFLQMACMREIDERGFEMIYMEACAREDVILRDFRLCFAEQMALKRKMRNLQRKRDEAQKRYESIRNECKALGSETGPMRRGQRAMTGQMRRKRELMETELYKLRKILWNEDAALERMQAKWEKLREVGKIFLEERKLIQTELEILEELEYSGRVAV